MSGLTFTLWLWLGATAPYEQYAYQEPMGEECLVYAEHLKTVTTPDGRVLPVAHALCSVRT
jgi:hypothetical protein